MHFDCSLSTFPIDHIRILGIELELQPVAKRVETLRQKTAHSTNSIRHTSNTPLPLFKVV